MQQLLSSTFLFRYYAIVVLLSSLATIYVLVKPGISTPVYPEKKLSQALNTIGSSSLIATSKINVDKNTSDRKLTPIYTYSYVDGSKILATMVRVRKKGDFKIETYGLLTKNIDSIYLKNSAFVNSLPPSHFGMIGNDKYIQTCVVPKSSQLSESDYRLDNLTSIVEHLNPRQNTLLDRVLGTKVAIDYSCLVLTYKPSSSSTKMPPTSWKEIVNSVQRALRS
jgi:hypothetical protein